MSERVINQIRDMVRAQITNAIKDDLEGGGESLMKEVFENLESDFEAATAYDEMRRCIDRIGSDSRREVALEELVGDLRQMLHKVCNDTFDLDLAALDDRAKLAGKGGDPRPKPEKDPA